ncbi:hypothetical protein VZT92_023001 [Zoarces viviparus]|uniref:Uncharacterized protein n=1 Tax=Zoarces viviparus TaxID=48416 RepID=A0AAW1E570_ZOAVI
MPYLLDAEIGKMFLGKEDLFGNGKDILFRNYWKWLHLKMTPMTCLLSHFASEPFRCSQAICLLLRQGGPKDGPNAV